MASNQKVAAAKKAAEAQVKASQRKAMVGWIAAGVVVVALFAFLVAYIVREGTVAAVPQGDQLSLASADETYGIPVGDTGVVGEGLDDSRVRLDVYYDFMCPYCGLFEESQGPVLDALREEGLVDVYYHPLNFLDRFSQGTEYSTRSASAAALIASEEPDKYMDFVQLMFENQPAENTTGLSDAQIVQLAKQAGVSDEVADRIPAQEFVTWVNTGTETASQNNISFTPAIVINGELQDVQNDDTAVNWSIPGQLEQRIRDLAGS